MITFSPSQISLFQRCPRRWAFSRVREREPETNATRIGQECHDLAQAWGETGAVPPSTLPGKIVMSVIELLPQPGTAAHEYAANATMGGVTWSMRLDWIDKYVPATLVSIGDLKTTGDFQYAKTADDLDSDPQAVIYGHWAAETFDVPHVRRQWVYAKRCKAPPPGFAVTSWATREALAAAFEPLAEQARTMLVLRGLDPNDVPRDLGDCYMHRRPCGHMHECYKNDPPNSLDHAASTLVQLRR